MEEFRANLVFNRKVRKVFSQSSQGVKSKPQIRRFNSNLRICGKLILCELSVTLAFFAVNF